MTDSSSHSRVTRITATNWTDAKGLPAGGMVVGQGISISFQDGPVKVNGENGAQVEDVLHAALQRLEWLNSGAFRCRENSLAITEIESALHWLRDRTERRVREGTEGTHIGN
jgi:hypothetical protein